MMEGQVPEFQGAWQEESTGQVQMEPYVTKEAAGPSVRHGQYRIEHERLPCQLWRYPQMSRVAS